MEQEYNGFLIVADGTFGYKEIKPVGRGSVPVELRGRYTNDRYAKGAIDSYLESDKGVKKGAKANSAG